MEQMKTTSKIDSDVLHEVKYLPVEKEYESVTQFRSENEAKRSATWFFNFVVLTGLTALLVGGTSMTWSSSAILKLKSNDSNINPLGRPVTTAEISKLLGIPGMMSLVGSSLLPTLSDLIGRKRSFQVICSTMFLGIVGVAFTNRLDIMITFLCIVTISFAGMVAVFPIYLTEICEDHYRSKYSCLVTVFYSLGQVYSYIIGPIFSFRNFTLLTAAPMFPSLLLLFFAPESQVYSLRKGRKQECLTILGKLRNYNSSKDLIIDFQNIEHTLSITKETKSNSIVKLFGTKEGRTGVLLSMLPYLVQHMCGALILMPLMAPILSDASSSISGNTIAILVGSVKVVSFSFTSLIVERVGNRPLLIISSAAAGLPISVLGLYFYLKHINSQIIQQLQWVPLVCVVLYFIGYSLGVGPIPDCLISILFNSDLRSVGSAFIMTTVGVIFSCYLVIYPLLEEAIGTHWCMWIFGATCFLGSILFYIWMPETKGKTVLEIQQILKYH